MNRDVGFEYANLVLLSSLLLEISDGHRCLHCRSEPKAGAFEAMVSHAMKCISRECSCAQTDGARCSLASRPSRDQRTCERVLLPIRIDTLCGPTVQANGSSSRSEQDQVLLIKKSVARCIRQILGKTATARQ